MSFDNNGQDFWLGETVAMLALSSIRGVGYWTLRRLTAQSIGFKELLKVEPYTEFIERLKRAGSKIYDDAVPDWSEYQKELWAKGQQLYQRLKGEGIQIVHSGEENFPKSLHAISETPKWLFVQGDLSLLHRTSVAIVGTRDPTDDGLFLANYVGACLPYFDAVTVSGLASGIDQIVHQKSIRFNTPTVAVLGTGILREYPANSNDLRRKILECGGAIVSEYLPNQNYSAENFVRRNRLQAGLARVIIPVEWAERSGTAHTVRYAGQARKQIFCLRMPDWSPEEHPELSFVQQLGGEVFTIPGEETAFIKAIREKLQDDPPSIQQLNLWPNDSL